MSDGANGRETQHVSFLLLPRFSMMAFTAAVEPLRIANLLAESELYRWEIVSPDGNGVRASNGVRVEADCAPAAPSDAWAVLVCAGLGVEHYRDERIHRWLRGQGRRGAALGGICTGTFVLARAGLLEGYRCTIHWENVEGFIEEFPALNLTANLYEIDRDRFTCSGGTAPLDMMLYAIGQRHGAPLAARVAEQMLYTAPRHPQDTQRLSLRERTGLDHPKLLAVIAQMETVLETPATLEELGSGVGRSPRQLERLFRTHLDTTPKRYYLRLRLDRARLLLRQTSMPIAQVAVACGFTSASHFARTYRAQFGQPPRAERKGLPFVA